MHNACVRTLCILVQRAVLRCPFQFIVEKVHSNAVDESTTVDGERLFVYLLWLFFD